VPARANRHLSTLGPVAQRRPFRRGHVRFARSIAPPPPALAGITWPMGARRPVTVRRPSRRGRIYHGRFARVSGVNNASVSRAACDITGTLVFFNIVSDVPQTGFPAGWGIAPKAPTTTATATATTLGGVVVSVNPGSQGDNYPTAPTVTLSGGGGSGATAVAN